MFDVDDDPGDMSAPPPSIHPPSSSSILHTSSGACFVVTLGTIVCSTKPSNTGWGGLASAVVSVCPA